MGFKLIAAKDIDRLKWDSCVHFATQPAFSGYTWYLNALSKDWIGLVEGDYETVMPLFFQKDWLGRRVYDQPIIFAPNGPFSNHVISRTRILAMLKELPNRSRNVLLVWEGQTGISGIQSTKVPRDVLQLYDNYAEVVKRFSNVGAEQMVDWQHGSPTPELITEFWFKHNNGFKSREMAMHRFRRIIYQTIHRGQGFAASILNARGEMAAMAFFIHAHGYVYRIISASIPGQDGDSAMYELYRSMIETYAGRPLVLDFNGDPMGQMFGAIRLQYTLVSNG